MSLIEVTASTLLVGLLLLTSVQTTSGLVRSQAETQSRLVAENYAEELLAEVIAAPYALAASDRTALLGSPPPETEFRDDMLEMLDYRDQVYAPPTTPNDVAIAELVGWSAQVEIVAVDPANPSQSLPDATGVLPNELRRITITMMGPSGEIITRVGLVSRCPRAIGLSGDVSSFVRFDIDRGSTTQLILAPLPALPEN